MKIVSRLKPFSHVPGELFLFPGTTLAIRCFPTRIEAEDLEDKRNSFWIEYSWTGPVREFTAELDYQKQQLRLFGFAQEGYFSYHLKKQGGSLVLHIDKSPASTFFASSLFPKKPLQTIKLVSVTTKEISSSQMLLLGSHKAQEITKMRQRLDPCELFPLWLKTAELCPQGNYQKGVQGHYALLKACTEQDKATVVSAFLSFFQSAFQGCFVPRLFDNEYQGIAVATQEKGSVIPLLLDSAASIRSFFYKEIAPDHIELLPLLPKELPCGRLMDITTKEGVHISFEWRKNSLRSVVLASDKPCLLKITLPKGLASCRLNKKSSMPIQDRRIEVLLKAKKRIYLDRFAFAGKK